MNEGSPLWVALFQALLSLLHAAFTLEHSFFQACVFLSPPLCLCSPSLGSCLSFSALPTSPGIALFSSHSFFPPFSSIQFPISFASLSLFSFKSSFSLLNSASVSKGREKLEKWSAKGFFTVHRPPSADTGMCQPRLGEGREFAKVPIGQDAPVVTDKEPQVLQPGKSSMALRLRSEVNTDLSNLTGACF